MKSLNIFLYEWKHFTRSPFKVVTLLLFILAGAYGLHNGAALFHEQMAEIEKIEGKIAEERQKYLAYYDAGKSGPEDRPWVDISTPFWAIMNANVYHFKMPSPAMVYSMGQAEQYGFYKQVTFWASPYDTDMAEEIANPERLQTGTLDFSFTLLFLLPLLLLILLYNLRSAEAEQGFLPLIEVQIASKNTWLFSRLAFYFGMTMAVLVGLLGYGAVLTGVFSAAGNSFLQMLLFSFIYLVFWSLIYFLILRSGRSILGNTLKMVCVWLVLAFVVPGGVHQWIKIEKPTNLMTDLIDASRDEKQKLFSLPDSVFQAKLHTLFPEIVKSPVAKEGTQSARAYNRSASALVNELMKESIVPIEADNQARNQLVRTSYLFNPITFFQNRINRISETHYDDYQDYRQEIQALIDQQIAVLVEDIWAAVVVDKPGYVAYQQRLNPEAHE